MVTDQKIIFFSFTNQIQNVPMQKEFVQKETDHNWAWCINGTKENIIYYFIRA